MSAQINAPSARWSVWLQPERPVRICTPPTIAWIGKSRPAASASRRTMGRSRCVRHAAAATTRTMSPTTIATQRWRMWALVASVIVGKSVPFMSGQSLKTYHCDVAVTWEPNSSKAKTVAAPNAATRVKRWLLPRPPIRAG